MRHLRHYENVANISHFCGNCMKYINPGELYSGDVYVNKNEIYVEKRHLEPLCDWPDFEDKFENFVPLERNIERVLESDFSIAAIFKKRVA